MKIDFPISESNCCLESGDNLEWNICEGQSEGETELHLAILASAVWSIEIRVEWEKKEVLFLLN